MNGTGIIISLIVAIIVFLVIAYIRWTNSPKGMARSTARTMLASMMAIQSKFHYPVNSDSGKFELYEHVLSMRPTYTKDVINDVLSKAKRLSEAFNEPQGTSFNAVVFSVIKREFSQTWHREPTREEVDKMLSGIDTILTR